MCQPLGDLVYIFILRVLVWQLGAGIFELAFAKTPSARHASLKFAATS